MVTSIFSFFSRMLSNISNKNYSLLSNLFCRLQKVSIWKSLTFCRTVELDINASRALV